MGRSDVSMEGRPVSESQIGSTTQYQGNTIDGCNVINDIPNFNNHVAKFSYEGFSIPIAMYAVTEIIKDPGVSRAVNPLQSMGDPPEIVTISTDVRELTAVVRNVLIFHELGVIFGYYNPQTAIYTVQLSSTTQKQLNKLNTLYQTKLEKSNFYRGKCLEFQALTVKFIKRPLTKFDDVVLPSLLKQSFISNTYDFILNKKLHTITKKRGVILYGPPGNGKTSMISALMGEIKTDEVSIILVSATAFHKRGISEFIDFVTTYLLPAIVILEDFDLVAGDRKIGSSSIIGDILEMLDGVEKFNEPIVVLGTTNRFDIIDEAAVRPCRFDRRIEVNYPEKPQIEELWLKLGGIGKCPEKILDKKFITGAHIREIVTTAKMIAINESGKEKLEKKFIDQAIDEVLTSFYVSGTKTKFGFNDYEEDLSSVDEETSEETSEEPKVAESAPFKITP